MADINEILGRQINSVKELKTAIKELQDSLVGVDAESEEFKTTTQQLSAAQEELNKVTRAGKADTDAAKDSIVGMKNEYKALYDQYKLLSDEQRNSDFGKNMASSLETLSTKINEAQKNVGSFKDNIGRYSEGVTDAFNKMGVSAGALKGPLQAAKVGTVGLNGAFKALAANPIMLAITAIVAILVKAAAAIKKNEELTNRLREAMAVFKPILDAVANAFDFLAGIIVKVVEGLSKVAEKIMSVIPGMREAIKSHKDLAKATNDLTKAQRENSVVASQKQAEIERLREEASATEDVAEKRRLLEEAKAMQAEVDQREIELAQEELRILQEYGEKTANAAEENEKLAAAQKKVNDLIAQGERNQRMYNKQLDATTKKTSSSTSARKTAIDEEKKKAQELHEQLIENNKTEITKLTEKYEKEKKLLEKYHLDTSLLTKKYQKDMQEEMAKTTRRYLEGSNRSLEAIKAWSDLDKELNDYMYGPMYNLEERVKELETTVPGRLNKIDAAFDKFLESIEGNAPLMEAAWKAYFNVDSKTIASDFQAVVDAVTYEMDKLSINFPEKAAEMKKALDALLEFGPEKWAEGLKEVEITSQELEKLNGISLDKIADIETQLDLLPKKIKEVQDELSQLRIDKVIKDSDEASLNLELDKILTGTFRELEILRAQNEAESLDAQKKAYEKEIVEFKGTQDKKLELMSAYYEVLQKMQENQLALEELNRQRTEEMFESLIDLSDRMAGSLSTYRSSQEQLIESQVKAGYIDEKEAKKKKKRLLDLQRVERDFSIATITADAAAGIFSVWKGYATEVGVINPQAAAATTAGGPAVLAALNTKSLITAIAKTASLATTAAAQIAAAQNGYVTAKNNFSAESGGGSSSSAGVGATPVVVDSTPYTYTRTIQTQDEKDELNRPIYVTVTDIQEGLDHKAQVTDESSF